MQNSVTGEGAAVIGTFIAPPETLAVIAWVKEEATRRCGLSDFGPPDFEEGMARIITEIEAEPISDQKRAFWREEMILKLIGRAAREAGWKANPGYAKRSIPAPLVICGIPRTGTTALHKVMSLDPQFQGLEHWLAMWPEPRPPRAEWPDRPGYKLAADILRARMADIPGMMAQHEVVVDEVDECFEILSLDFVNNRWPSMGGLPAYDRWMQAQDETPFYRNLADTLRLIGLNDDRPWLLKNPGHFVEIEALLSVFPDARVIVTHRDPVKSMGSVASILSDVRKVGDPDPDLKAIGPRELAYWAKGKDNMAAARAARPAEQFHDVQHVDFHADPIGTVRGIYDHFGLTLSAETAKAMQAWLDANPSGKHGAHHYDLADFGLTAEEVRAALGDG